MAQKILLCTALAVGLLISGCSTQADAVSLIQPTQAATETSVPVTATFTSLPSATATPTPTDTPLPSATATKAPTAAPTATATITPTASPTVDPFLAVAEMRAFCRYGPGTAYLYSHELKAGDEVTLDGRDGTGNWLWVQPQNLNRHCWAAASVLSVNHPDLNELTIVESRLPEANNLYSAPTGVGAARSGDSVTITWNAVWMTEDDNRGYLVEAVVCQGGEMVTVNVQVAQPGVTVTDEEGCDSGSSGRLYTVEKHGYTNPVEIPWP